MKKAILAILLCLLLLTACGKPEVPTTAATTAATTAETVTAEATGAALAGVWVNAGQYSEGRDFVETLTLNRDGTASVHLDYRGADYATLEGQWTADGSVLNVTFQDPNVRDRTYSYTLSETTLVLTGDGKDVTYQRQN